MKDLSSAPESQYEKLSGVIERVTFHSEETGWSIVRVTPMDYSAKIVTVSMHQPQIIPGDSMDFYGSWVVHPKYGRQFKAEKCISRKPASAGALEKYLGSGLIFGVGPKTAYKIVKFFGDETLQVFDTEIDRLMEVPSIGEAKLRQIKESWEEHKAIKDVMIFLQSHGISTLYSVKIYKQYGNDAIVIVSRNPYTLSKDIYGIGFFTADKIARNLGFAADSPERIGAGIKHVLDTSRESGHCYLTREQMFLQVKQLLELEDEGLINEPLMSLIKSNQISIREMDNGDIYYYPNSLYWDEIHLINRIKKIMSYQHETNPDRVRDWLLKYCEKISMELSDEQFETAVGVSCASLNIITGGPGCGKTTTTKAIVRMFEAMQKKVLLAAPTGRAAQRMSEVIGREAKTIHRLLVWKPKDGKFEKNEETPLETQVLIVDEASMLDISLAASLFKAVPDNCQIILIGDADQLPSVGPGNVLHDLLSIRNIPHFSLTKIFRQAQESLIITCAHAINTGKLPVIPSAVQDNTLFKSKTDCLFIDSDEATQEQLKFIKRARMAIREVAEGGSARVFQRKENEHRQVVARDDSGDVNIYHTVQEISEPYEVFNIPSKLYYTDLNRLAQSNNGADELRSVLKQIPPFSTLNHGMTASQSIVRLVSETLPRFYSPEMEIQILSPMIKGSLGTANLNKEIQQKINPYREGHGQIKLGERAIRVNDRVIQNVNNYDLEWINSKEKGVFNGEIGKVKVVDSQDFSAVIDFGGGKLVKYAKGDLTEISLAYAITIHKSQGSEFPIVIIPVLTQHYTMLFRNLIYTGLTRAKRLAILVGSRKALALAIQRIDMKSRQTTLAYLLEKHFSL